MGSLCNGPIFFVRNCCLLLFLGNFMFCGIVLPSGRVAGELGIGIDGWLAKSGTT